MKKFYLITTLLVVTSSIYNTVNAQSPSIMLDAGYRLPLSGGLLGISNSNGNQTGVYGTYGEGFVFGATLNCYVSKGLALDFGGHYWLGSNVSYSTTSGSGNMTLSEAYKGKQNMLLLSFGLHYDFCNDSSKFNPYIGAGMELGVAGNMKYSETVNSDYDSKTYQTVTQATITDKAVLGAYSELGINYRTSSKVSLFARLKVNTLSVMPDKSVTTSLTENGTDVTGALTSKYKETDYVKTVPSSYDPNDSTKPTQQIGTPYPLSSFEISIGVKFKF